MRSTPVSSRLIHDQDAVRICFDLFSQHSKEHAHRPRVHQRGLQCHACSCLWLHRHVHLQPLIPSLLHRRGTRTRSGPRPRGRALLAEPSLIHQQHMLTLAAWRGRIARGLHRREADSLILRRASRSCCSWRERGSGYEYPSLCRSGYIPSSAYFTPYSSSRMRCSPCRGMCAPRQTR